MSGNLLQRFLVHLRSEHLFPEPGIALLAVSGGPDSVALLDLMTGAAGESGLHIAVAHVDHGIHADSADVAEAVMGLAVRYEVRGYLATLNLGPEATETQARRHRYEALRGLQRRLGARYLVTAHHADDQVETVLFRLLRGTAPAGLAGIQPMQARGLVRPLLPFRRSELGEWIDHRAAVTGVSPPVHVDPSNWDSRHDRVWVRQQVLPVLRQRFGSDLDRNILGAARHAAADRRAWSAVLRHLPDLEFRCRDGLAEVARGPLQGYDNVLSEAILRAVAREVDCVVGPRRAARLRRFAATASSGRTLELGHGWVAETAFRRLRLRRETATSDALPGTRLGWGEKEGGRVDWGPWVIVWRRGRAERLGRQSLTTWVTGREGAVRAPRPGDRLRPLGFSGRRRVSRLLMESEVPRPERPTFPVIVQGGEIVWLPGVCRADVALPEPGELAVRLDVSVAGNSEADWRS